jgi:glutaminase
MTCSELIFLFQWGKTKEGKQILTKSQRELNALMQTLRFYDESGEFTYKGITGQKWYWRWYCGFIP